MVLPLLLTLALASEVREALPPVRWTPQDVRAVVRAILRDDRVDEEERDMLRTLSEGRPWPPAPAPGPEEAHLLGLLAVRPDLPALFRADSGWRTLVELATLSPQTEGIVVGSTARWILDSPAEAGRLERLNAALPEDLREAGARILEDARAQVRGFPGSFRGGGEHGRDDTCGRARA